MSEPSRYADLSHAELTRLIPELMLVGQMIDRSGMAWCISAFGREEMVQIAIEEWAAASPIYTARMQRALDFAPEVPGRGDVVTIFKGLQLDIGAPPQFLDFRFTVHDPWHGEFALAHCGALVDVEPMGEAYVAGMCHTIEDPTFDATAVATNPKAQVRPIHRPPGVPAAGPVCAWTVTIDHAFPDAVGIPALAVNALSRAAATELAPIVRGVSAGGAEGDGLGDYRGPLMSDLDFASFSHSALVRIADEMCLQMALLDRAFVLALQKRCAGADLVALRRKQLTGFSGIAARRLARALGLGTTPGDALRLLELHPMLNPAAYVGLVVGEEGLQVLPGPADEDGAWVTLMGREWTAPLSAAVREVDPSFDVEVTADPAGAGWRIAIVRTPGPREVCDEVAVTLFSSGSDFVFEPRRSLPVVGVS